MLNIGGKLRLILKSNIDKHDLIAITDKNSGIHIRTYNVVQTQKVVVLMPSLSPLCVLPVNLMKLNQFRRCYFVALSRCVRLGV